MGGDCETDFLELLSVVGSVAAALAFSKNIALLRCSHCEDLCCLCDAGREVHTKDGAALTPALQLWGEWAEPPHIQEHPGEQPVKSLVLVISFLFFCIPYYFKVEEYGSAFASALFIFLKYNCQLH